jgi:hypothetical protein
MILLILFFNLIQSIKNKKPIKSKGLFISGELLNYQYYTYLTSGKSHKYSRMLGEFFYKNLVKYCIRHLSAISAKYRPFNRQYYLLSRYLLLFLLPSFMKTPLVTSSFKSLEAVLSVVLKTLQYSELVMCPFCLM